MNRSGSNSSCFYLVNFIHFRPVLFIIQILLFSSCFPTTYAVKNITISSDNPSIRYRPAQGAWDTMGDSRATQGAFRLARTLDAYATITRNFRALHFVSPLWSFPVVVQVSIDNLTQTIDLQDYSVPTTKFPPTGMSRATQPSQIVWTFYGIDDERTVIVSTGESDSGPVAVVDRLIFEVAEPGDLPTLSPGSPRTTLLAYPSATTSSSILPPASSPRDSGIAIHNQPSTRQDLQEKAKRQGLIAIILAIFIPITLVLLGALVACLLIRKRYDAFRVRRMRSSAWIRGSGLFGGSHDGMSPLRDEEVVMWPKKGGLTEVEPIKQSFDNAYSNDWSLQAPYAVTTPVLNFHIPFTRKPSDVAAHHSGDDPASPIDEENAYTESEHSVELHPSGSHEVYVLPKQFCESYVQHPVPPTSESLLSPIPPKASMPRALYTSHAVIREAHTRDSSISGRLMWTVPRSISSRSGTIDTWSSFGNHPLSSRMTERTNIVDSQRRSEEFSPVSPLGLDEADNESLSSHYPSTQWHEVIPGLTIPFGRLHAPVVRHSIPVPARREELSRF